MRCFFLTGEPSGDKLGAIIAAELKNKHNTVVQGWGASHMRSVGVDIVQDTEEMSVMGYLAVLKKAPQFLRLLSKSKQHIKAFNPDVLVLIDYGGFNLKVAKWAKSQGYRVVYYSPPKVWATRGGRLKQLKDYCDEVIVLYPFERDYYHNQGLEVVYHGHPLADTSKSSQINAVTAAEKGPLRMALLPGSRRQEVIKILPAMLEAAIELDDYDLVISCASSIQEETITSMVPMSMHHRTQIVKGDIHSFLHLTDIALVASGTATIEVAVTGIPQVVCYKTSSALYHIAKRLIKVDYISLVNLILKKEAVAELIQDDCNGPKIAAAVRKLEVPAIRTSLIEDYDEIKMLIYNPKSVELTAKTIMRNI